MTPRVLPARAPRRPYSSQVLPAWLLWLLPVPAATLGAIAWASWSSRVRGPEEAEVSVQAHERFRRAMAAPLPTAAQSPSSGGSGR